MRLPNHSSVPILDRARSASRHRRPTCVIEEVDDDEDVAPSGPSRPVSRQTIARRDISPRSAHRYRSTPRVPPLSQDLRLRLGGRHRSDLQLE